MSETSTYRVEIVSRLRSVTDDMAWAVRGLSPSKSAYRASDEEWSIHEHLAHMRDMEQEVYLPLLRWATVPDMLDPLDYSRRDWHQHRYNPEEPLPRVMDDVQRMRDEELLIFREMTDATWTRMRSDTRWGPLTCQWIAELMYRHVLDHLQGVMALKQDLNLAALQPPPALVVGGYIGGRGG
ncbi:MAG: DinB family protein [Dehalococcoidia bacterium]